LDFDLARGADALIIIENSQRRVVRLENGDGYDAELRYVVDCVARGRQPETVTAKDGVTALEICEAEEASLRTGRMVSCVFTNQDQPN
jgi:predicted dehydrogenase